MNCSLATAVLVWPQAEAVHSDAFLAVPLALAVLSRTSHELCLWPCFHPHLIGAAIDVLKSQVVTHANKHPGGGHGDSHASVMHTITRGVKRVI